MLEHETDCESLAPELTLIVFRVSVVADKAAMVSDTFISVNEIVQV